MVFYDCAGNKWQILLYVYLIFRETILNYYLAKNFLIWYVPSTLKKNGRKMKYKFFINVILNFQGSSFILVVKYSGIWNEKWKQWKISTFNLLHDICLVAIYSRFSLVYHSLHAIGHHHFSRSIHFGKVQHCLKVHFLFISR